MVSTHDGGAWARFSSVFPVLLLAQLVLVAMAVSNGVAGAGGGLQTGTIAGIAGVQALLMLLRTVPLLMLLSLPLLMIKRALPRTIALGVLWSLFIVVQVLLDQYFQVAHVPLGADLFGYSIAEIRTTLADGAPLGLRGVLALALP